MAINGAFKFLNIVAIRKAIKRKGVPLMGSARKETVGVEMVVAFSSFNSISRLVS